MIIKHYFTPNYQLGQSGKYYVYIIMNPQSNEPLYVGKGTGKRLYDHFTKSSLCGANPYKNNKIKHLIKSGFTVRVIKIISNIKESLALKYEELLVQLFGRKINRSGCLYNFAEGGVISAKLNEHPNIEDIKKRISNTIKNKKLSRGENNPCFGYFGKDHPAFGIKHSEESIKKRVETYKANCRKYGYNSGPKNPRFGDHRNYEQIHGLEKSERIKNKQSISRSGNKNANSNKCLIIKPNGEELIIDCLKDFCTKNNLSIFQMGRVARNEISQWRGWKCTKLGKTNEKKG